MNEYVFQQGDEWFFLDETGYQCGPFSSEYSAHLTMMRYCVIVLGC